MSDGMDEVQRQINERMANWKGDPDKIEITALRAEVERMRAREKDLTLEGLALIGKLELVRVVLAGTDSASLPDDYSEVRMAHDRMGEIIALRAENAITSQQLGNLLAIIHRDGGHHTCSVGPEQSIEDAHIAWARLVSKVERLRGALERIAADDESDVDINEYGGAAVARAALDDPEA